MKNPPTEAERKAKKASYDKERLKRERDKIKRQKAENFQRWYSKPENREAMRAYRAANMQRHVEYCRRPGYQAWKSQYDRQRRAKNDFGEFAEVALMLRDIEKEILERGEEEVNLDKAREKSNERRR